MYSTTAEGNCVRRVFNHFRLDKNLTFGSIFFKATMGMIEKVRSGACFAVTILAREAESACSRRIAVHAPEHHHAVRKGIPGSDVTLLLLLTLECVNRVIPLAYHTQNYKKVYSSLPYAIGTAFFWLLRGSDLCVL